MPDRYSRRVALTVLLAFASVSSEGYSQLRSVNQQVVLKGATIIDGSGSAPVQDAVIVIEGEKIKSVGGRGTAHASDAMVVDVAGKFIIPGIVDSHVHFRPWLGEMFLNPGVTTVMIPGNPDFSVAEREASYRSDARAPRIYSTAGRLSASPSMTREQVREMVRNWLAKKPDYAASLPVYNEQNKQVYRWIVEDVHEAGLMVFGHTENAPESVKVGRDVVEHIAARGESVPGCV